MSSRKQRVSFSIADCHRLVDIVHEFKGIIECKKTDGVTSREKNLAWEKIGSLYNGGTTEPKTADQLRCKFDNLKKEVRKYLANKKRSLYLTGGGSGPPEIKSSLKDLYNKIEAIIELSCHGMQPSIGDSDFIPKDKSNTVQEIQPTQLPSEDIVLVEAILSEEIIIENVEASEDCGSVSVPQTCTVQENMSPVTPDWSSYTPKMLKTKKNHLLRVKKKSKEEEPTTKEKMFNLKKKLMEEESVREVQWHTQRMEKEKELYDIKISNENLLKEKISLEIQLLKKQLQ